MFPYGKILRQALKLTRKHKFLWWLGLFLGWTGIFNLFSFLSPNEIVKYQTRINNWLGVTLVVVVVILVYLFFRAKAGLIGSIKSILDKTPATFRQAFKSSRFFYRRIFNVYLLIYLCLFFITLLLATPVMYLLAISLDFRALILIILALIIFVPISVVAAFLQILSPLFVVIYDLKSADAIKASFDLFRQFWPQLIVFGFFLLLVVSAIYIPVVFLIYLFYHKVAVLVFILAIFLMIQAGLAVFQQTAWVLVFNELTKPQKLEEAEVEAAPETV